MCKKILGIATENKKGRVWAVLSGVQHKQTFSCESWEQCRLLHQFYIKLLVKIMHLRNSWEEAWITYTVVARAVFRLYISNGPMY